MPTGTVVRFDRRRGYGFIQPDDQGEDVFVHQNNIQMEGFRFLDVGERVGFELEVGDKGMKAVSVSLLEPRKPRPEGAGDMGGGMGGPMGGGYDRPAAPRREFTPRAPAAPAAPRAGGDDRSRRKLERLISILTEKGILAAGEVDGIDQVAAAVGVPQA